MTERRTWRGAGRGAGAALVLLGLVAVVVAALRPGDQADPAPGRAAVRAAASQRVAAVVDDRRFGVHAELPPGWARLPGTRAIRLRGDAGRVGVSITTVASHPDLGLHAAVERSVREGLAAVEGRDARGRPLQALVATVAGRHRTYAVVAFRGAGATAAGLTEARHVVASLRFFAPGVRRSRPGRP